jgi:hypothetical protein
VNVKIFFKNSDNLGMMEHIKIKIKFILKGKLNSTDVRFEVLTVVTMKSQ